jgi:hypothetical protein
MNFVHSVFQMVSECNHVSPIRTRFSPPLCDEQQHRCEKKYQELPVQALVLTSIPSRDGISSIENHTQKIIRSDRLLDSAKPETRCFVVVLAWILSGLLCWPFHDVCLTGPAVQIFQRRALRRVTSRSRLSHIRQRQGHRLNGIEY